MIQSKAKTSCSTAPYLFFSLRSGGSVAHNVNSISSLLLTVPNQHISYASLSSFLCAVPWFKPEEIKTALKWTPADASDGTTASRTSMALTFTLPPANMGPRAASPRHRSAWLCTCVGAWVDVQSKHRKRPPRPAPAVSKHHTHRARGHVTCPKPSQPV